MESQYRRTTHAVYGLNYHFVWPPKYRKHVVTKEVQKFLESLFPKVAMAYGFEVLEQNVQSDHIHLSRTEYHLISKQAISHKL
ncbi:MAG: IS200/IS605 family transposase [Patescibacteria group bacterium]